jgi:hypothetical protein
MIEGAIASFTGAKYNGWRAAEDLVPLINADLRAAIGLGDFPDGVTFTVAYRLLPLPQSVVVTVHGLPPEMAAMPLADWIDAEIRGVSDDGVCDLIGQISKIVNAYNQIDLALYGPERDEVFGLTVELAAADQPVGDVR